MYIRMIFAETSDVTEDTQCIDDIITGDITEDETRIQAEKVLNVLGISENDIETLAIEPYWKIDRSYDVNIHCKGNFPDEENLLKVADIWNCYGIDEKLSSWSIPNNKMRFKLTFINIMS